MGTDIRKIFPRMNLTPEQMAAEQAERERIAQRNEAWREEIRERLRQELGHEPTPEQVESALFNDYILPEVDLQVNAGTQQMLEAQARADQGLDRERFAA